MDIKDKDGMKIPLNIAQDFISECMKKRGKRPPAPQTPRAKKLGPDPARGRLPQNPDRP